MAPLFSQCESLTCNDNYKMSNFNCKVRGTSCINVLFHKGPTVRVCISFVVSMFSFSLFSFSKIGIFSLDDSPNENYASASMTKI